MSVSPAQRGLGICLACHAHDVRALAADQVAGAACARHLRDPDWVPERPGAARRQAIEARRAATARAAEAAAEAEIASAREAFDAQMPDRPPARARRRRSWSQLTAVGREICAAEAVRPTGWTVPAVVWERIGRLDELGLRRVGDAREARALLDEALAASPRRFRADRYWNLRAVLAAVVWGQDSLRGGVVQMTEERIAGLASEFKARWADEGRCVPGYGGPADLANLGMTQRTASTCLDILAELRLLYRALRGASAEALGAEHGRASIYVLTAARVDDAGERTADVPGDPRLFGFPVDAPAERPAAGPPTVPPYPQEVVDAAGIEVPSPLPTSENSPRGTNFLPPLWVPIPGEQAAQAPPGIGSGLLGIELDPNLHARCRYCWEEPLTRLWQRQTEVSSLLSGLSDAMSAVIEPEYLDDQVYRERDTLDQEDDGDAERREAAARKPRFAPDPLWTKRNPRSRRARQEATARILSLGGYSGSLRVGEAMRIFRRYFEAGWTPAGIMHAIDRRPDGTYHPAAWRAGRNPAALVTWRLGLWRHADGTVHRPPFDAVAPYARARTAPGPDPARAAAITAARAEAEQAAAARRASDEGRRRGAAAARAAIRRPALP